MSTTKVYSVEWYGDRWFREYKGQLERNMNKAVLTMIREVKKAISRTQPTKRVGTKLVGLDPSKPGEPPKVVTGTLRANVGGRVDVTQSHVRGFYGVKVGPADKYALALELGYHGVNESGHMINLAPRPYLRVTQVRHRERLKHILGEGL